MNARSVGLLGNLKSVFRFLCGLQNGEIEALKLSAREIHNPSRAKAAQHFEGAAFEPKLSDFAIRALGLAFSGRFSPRSCFKSRDPLLQGVWWRGSGLWRAELRRFGARLGHRKLGQRRADVPATCF